MSLRTAPAGDVVVTPSTRTHVRRWRGPVLAVLAVLVASVLLALAQGVHERGRLDPDATDPSGSGALAALLEQQGVRVVRVTTAEEARDALYAAQGSRTLLVAAELAPISPRMADAAMSGPRSHVVVVGADESLTLFAPWARVSGYGTSPDEVPPGCGWDLAARVGPLVAQGALYGTAYRDVVSCWNGFVLDLPTGSGLEPTTVVGGGDPFTNDRLADSGNAALGLDLLGRDGTVVWWLPSLADPLQRSGDGQGASVGDLVPGWVPLALAQLVAALLVAVWWRGRRLGRVVLEPLPVVVRATEAVEGRARLYRRAGDRGRAADVLRGATTARLRGLLRMPRSASVAEVVDAAARRTGRDPAGLAALLSPGGDPTDDAGLTRLADALDTLEDEVRRS